MSRRILLWKQKRTLQHGSILLRTSGREVLTKSELDALSTIGLLMLTSGLVVALKQLLGECICQDQAAAVLLEDFMWLDDFAALARLCSRQAPFLLVTNLPHRERGKSW